MNITEFLLARIAEDEEAARHGIAGDLDHLPYITCQCGRRTYLGGNARRMLAECQAKRAIIECHKNWPVLIQTPPRMEPVNPTDPTTLTYRATQEIQWATQQQYIDRFGTEPPTAPMLEQLAAVYADHPDYNPAWRP